MGDEKTDNVHVKPKAKHSIFKKYYSFDKVQKGLENGELIQGSIRINLRNYEECYLDNPNGLKDIVISGISDRNRALHNDVVAVKIKSKDDQSQQTTAEVVCIVEKKHSRVAVGCLKQMQDKNSNWALFSPTDCRIPRLMVPIEECPASFLTRPQDFEKMLFIAKIVQWDEYSKFARGNLCKSLGECGEIEPETEGMLASFDIDASEFSQSVIDCLPCATKEHPWTIPKEEFAYRRDFRDELLFTIDPTTARDLDDALHVKDLGDGFYEIGVHIADVSYFVKPETELDQSATSRATSVYLIHKVIPMLPRLLCEELCSLNPGVDRLAFSVVWKMSSKGAIYEEWFGRSVIRSCCKLTYDVAQGFINEPTRIWETEELPRIFNDRTSEEIGRAVRVLQEMSVNMRQRRHDSGALRLDQPKLSFSLDKETGLPNGCTIYELKDSNRLIEEFMLLANMAVAHRIYKHFPETAVLRRHPPPKPKVLTETYLSKRKRVVMKKILNATQGVNFISIVDVITQRISVHSGRHPVCTVYYLLFLIAICKEFGFELDPTSSTTLQASLRNYFGYSEKAVAVWNVLMQLISKPMNLAVYFCSGSLEFDEDYRHYALNVPLYTHFTSPIRRYPDIMVHRLLAASLDYCDSPTLTVKDIDRITKHCNDRKVSAKACSDQSAEMFFAIFVKNCGPIDEKGAVVGVMDHSLDVLIIRFGLIKRVYCNKLIKLARFLFEKCENDGGAELTGKLTLYWSSGETQALRMFDLVDLVLSAGEEPLRYNVSLLVEAMSLI